MPHCGPNEEDPRMGWIEGVEAAKQVAVAASMIVSGVGITASDGDDHDEEDD